MRKTKTKLMKKLIYRDVNKSELKPEYVQLNNGMVVNKNLYKNVYKSTKKEMLNKPTSEILKYLKRKGE